jgi:DNA-directed RNA polymerase specialized sigma24 family protein
MSRPFEDSAIDAELIGRLLDEQGPALALYAAQWTDAADDCVQEALVELARQPAVPKHVVAWLYRAVKNRALNAARMDRRRRAREGHLAVQRLLLSRQSHSVGLADTDDVVRALSVSPATACRQYQQALVTLRQIVESPCSTKANPNSSNYRPN